MNSHSIIRWHSFFIQTNVLLNCFHFSRKYPHIFIIYLLETEEIIIYFCVHYFISLTLIYWWFFERLRAIYLHSFKHKNCSRWLYIYIKWSIRNRKKTPATSLKTKSVVRIPSALVVLLTFYDYIAKFHFLDSIIK